MACIAQLLASELLGAGTVGTYVTGVMNAHNTFETPEVVTEQVFSSYTKTSDGVRAELPKCSVICIRLKK